MFKVTSLHGADFGHFILYPSNFQLFFAFERPESLAILSDLPEPTYPSLPIFPWFYIAVRVLSSSSNTESFYLFFSGDSLEVQVQAASGLICRR